jgi:hypothetical protein
MLGVSRRRRLLITLERPLKHVIFNATLADAILAWLIPTIYTAKLPQIFVKNQGWIYTTFGMKDSTIRPFSIVSSGPFLVKKT